jgi:hypothetical protein
MFVGTLSWEQSAWSYTILADNERKLNEHALAFKEEFLLEYNGLWSDLRHSSASQAEIYEVDMGLKMENEKNMLRGLFLSYNTTNFKHTKAVEQNNSNANYTLSMKEGKRFEDDVFLTGSISAFYDKWGISRIAHGCLLKDNSKKLVYIADGRLAKLFKLTPNMDFIPSLRVGTSYYQLNEAIGEGKPSPYKSEIRNYWLPQAGLEAEVSYKYQSYSKGEFEIKGHGMWAHDISMHKFRVKITPRNYFEEGISLSTFKPEKTLLQLGSRLSWRHGDFTTSLSYLLEKKSNLISHIGTIMVKWNFHNT